MEDPRGWLFVIIIWAIMALAPYIIGGIACILILIYESKKRKNRKED